MLLKQTKIVATISDKRCEVDFIRQLFEAGMNVVRLNTAHLDFAGLEKLINNTRAVSNRIAILMDTKGPEVRTTTLEAPIDFHAGDRVRIVGDPERETTRACIAVSPMAMAPQNADMTAIAHAGLGCPRNVTQLSRRAKSQAESVHEG